MLKTTHDLSGKALLWAVCLVEGFEPYIHTVVTEIEKKGKKPLEVVAYSVKARTREITDLGWATFGHILEREDIWVRKINVHIAPAVAHLNTELDRQIMASLFKSKSFVAYGPSYLVAGMRCYVLAILGAEVDIPKELLEKT